MLQRVGKGGGRAHDGRQAGANAVFGAALGSLKATALMSTLFLLHLDATVPPKVVTDNILRTVGAAVRAR